MKGAMTFSFIEAIKRNPNRMSYGALLDSMQNTINQVNPGNCFKVKLQKLLRCNTIPVCWLFVRSSIIRHVVNIYGNFHVTRIFKWVGYFSSVPSEKPFRLIHRPSNHWISSSNSLAVKITRALDVYLSCSGLFFVNTLKLRLIDRRAKRWISTSNRLAVK